MVDLVWFLICLVLLIAAIVAYFIIKNKNFNNDLEAALRRNHFSNKYKVYDMGSSNIHLVQDCTQDKLGLIDEKSSKFITKLYSGFTVGDCISDNKSLVAIDHDRQDVFIIKKSSNNLSTRFFNKDQIVSAEINEVTDKKTKVLTKVNRGSQLAGAVIGNALAGGAGLIVGGVTASKTSTTKEKEYVNKVELKLNVEDTRDPIVTIELLELRVKKDSMMHRNALKKAEYWNGIFKALIHMSK